MAFTIYPAIDIRGGQCVRLAQGDYNQETVYHESPLEMAKNWTDQGASWLHVVDLDAARSGELANIDVIEAIVNQTSISVQVGGGVRNMDRLERLINAGVSRVVIGSAAIENPAFVQSALALYANQIAIGIDARDGFVATNGWLQQATVTAEELAINMAELGAKTFIFTDISRDGMLAGANGEATAKLAKACKQNVIASGGVATLADVEQLARLETAGVTGVIIGKALYTGAIQLVDALEGVKR
jgi:phosphoribosylformimino-5-aminoimidazole carboxamide ribotide isomerase